MNSSQEYNHHIDIKLRNKLQSMPVVFTEYCEALILSGKALSTVRVYLDNLSQFLNFTFPLGAQESFFRDISESEVKKYLDHIKTKKTGTQVLPTSTGYQALNWTSLNSFFQFLVPKYISHNPVIGISRPELKPKQESVFFTQGEIRKMLHNVIEKSNYKFINRDLSILRIGFSTGLTISSILRLDIDDLDLGERKIRIISDNGMSKSISIGTKTKAQLQLWLEDRNLFFPDLQSNALFISHWKQRLTINAVEKQFGRYAQGATDKKFTPQVMRNSCAVNLYEKTGNFSLCANQLGWKNLNFLCKYVKTVDSCSNDTVGIMDEIL